MAGQVWTPTFSFLAKWAVAQVACFGLKVKLHLKHTHESSTFCWQYSSSQRDVRGVLLSEQSTAAPSCKDVERWERRDGREGERDDAATSIESIKRGGCRCRWINVKMDNNWIKSINPLMCSSKGGGVLSLHFMLARQVGMVFNQSKLLQQIMMTIGGEMVVNDECW